MDLSALHVFAQGGQKRVLEPLELKLQEVVMTHHVGPLKSKQCSYALSQLSSPSTYSFRLLYERFLLTFPFL